MQQYLRMSIPKLNNVVIVGGSLAGLMHALTILEESPNTKIRILERSPSALLHNQGAGVVAGSEVQKFFHEYVRPGREIAVTSKQRLYLDKNGDIVDGSVDDREQRMTSWDVLYRLLRWRVDGMEADAYFDPSTQSLNDNSDKNNNGTSRDSSNEGPKASYEYGCIAKSISLPPAGEEDGATITWTDRDDNTQTTTADLVIAADGASSSIRAQLSPSVKRTYAGYVALRGTIPESSMSTDAKSCFSEKFAFFHTDGTQILAYLIPGGENGTLAPGSRLMNWVWYVNFEDGGQELEELMTGSDGRRHPITLPPGGMRPEIWEREKERARRVLPPQFVEIVTKTTVPFVQAITDVIGEENLFLGDRVVLVGDALAGFRPHTAASTGQAAFDALALGQWIRGDIGREEYREKCLRFARDVQRHGVQLGERSQFGRHPFA